MRSGVRQLLLFLSFCAVYPPSIQFEIEHFVKCRQSQALRADGEFYENSRSKSVQALP